MFGIFTGIAESIVDNFIRNTVDEPGVGSILYCDLFMGTSEHSGVYLGDGKIVHLNGKGVIEIVSPKEFVSGTTALSIYVSCIGAAPTQNFSVAERAKQYERKVGFRNYNFVMDNCHQFTAACILGDLENSTNFLWFLKGVCERELFVDSWRVWEKPGRWD
jgi:hypothetical protein